MHLNRFVKCKPAAMLTAASTPPRIKISELLALDQPLLESVEVSLSEDGVGVGLDTGVGDSPADAAVGDPSGDGGDDAAPTVGIAVGTAVGLLFNTAVEKLEAVSTNDSCSTAVRKEGAFIAEETLLSQSIAES